MSQLVVAQIQEKGREVKTWELKNWRKFHTLLAAKTNFIVQIDDVKLRFFMQPFEETVKLDKIPHSNLWYSLWVELLTGYEDVLTDVTASMSFYCEDFERSATAQKDAQLEFDKCNNNLSSNKQVAIKHFIQIKGWTTTAYANGSWRSEYEYNFSRIIKALDLKIELDVSTCAFEESPCDNAVEQISTVVNVDMDKLSARFATLLDDGGEGNLYDIKIILKDGDEIKGHMVILSGPSPVFKTMFQSEMQESQTGSVEVPDIGITAMRILLNYIYTGTVDLRSLDENIEEVIYAANKYELTGLIDYCDKMLLSFCRPNNAVALLRLAKLHNLPKAIAGLTEFLETNSARILLDMV